MRQAEVVAMRSLSDQLGMLNKNIEGLNADMREFSLDLKEVRERMIAMESSKLELRLEREIVRLEKGLTDAALERRRIEDQLESDTKVMNARITGLSTNLSNITGKLMPLGGIGLVILAAATSYLVKVL